MYRVKSNESFSTDMPKHVERAVYTCKSTILSITFRAVHKEISLFLPQANNCPNVKIICSCQIQVFYLIYIIALMDAPMHNARDG